jgi:hypothetical protein
MIAPSASIQKWIPKEIWMNRGDMASKDLYEKQWLMSLAQSYLFPKICMSMSDKYPLKTLDYVLRRCRELNMDFWFANGGARTLLLQNPKQLTDPDVIDFVEQYLENHFR